MSAVVLSGASGAPVLSLPVVKDGLLQSILKGVVFYGLLGGGLLIPFAGAVIQAFVID